MVLVTGPTGSGKSTSMYGMLNRLGIERRNVVNISTIEDPVEYALPRIDQVAVNATAGVEFATGLRTLLRQDPDIIMVGEIRDRETAEVAVRASLVGRLLISPFLVASTLTLVLAQRLVRRICVACRESVTPDPIVVAALRDRADFEAMLDRLRRDGALEQSARELDEVRTFRGKGCSQCGGSGFRGRLGLFEAFEPDDDVRALIMQRRVGSDIRATALAHGIRPMFVDGLAKALLGETTVEEVMRVAL
jgi:type IV pilus assembly protein PilB